MNLGFSRVPGEPKRYVLDLLRDENTYVFLCGLKGLEQGV